VSRQAAQFLHDRARTASSFADRAGCRATSEQVHYRISLSFRATSIARALYASLASGNRRTWPHHQLSSSRSSTRAEHFQQSQRRDVSFGLLVSSESTRSAAKGAWWPPQSLSKAAQFSDARTEQPSLADDPYICPSNCLEKHRPRSIG
jgi:hypothetical protein